MHTTEVAILGAGLAGLIAARRLCAAGIALEVLEARDRPGGRILSVDATGRPGAGGFDLGPSWFWPAAQPGMTALLHDLGVPSFAQPDDGDMLFERSADTPALRMAGADQGAARVTGGVGALIRALVATLPGRIRLNAPVAGLRLVPDGVILTIAGQGAALKARHVICTLPPRLMAGGVTLDPAGDPGMVARWRATPTWMAPHAKLVAHYDRPFWRDSGLSGMARSLVGPLAEVHDATTATGAAALFGFVGLPADARAAAGRDAVIAAAVAQLARLFGPQAARPRGSFLKDWATDPCTATAQDARPSGHPAVTRAPWVIGPWATRLHLAGAETSLSDPGLLAGAVEAGTRTARMVLRDLGG
ncbi:flavin monoamine oxidase family protein [Rhodobaculum claviforme]|uniref:Amine oxidase n=1 Tax=Rhodobaculum claviforme TaxID=1549854 RepID=A0A934TLA4_9RHOB|nr:FAD-dependent oxidoreductase [Rhodobaculum claviforme]MBK5927606.1 amine oxidase [Rhodobaculum claviforme]